jgi:serine protease Do
MVRFSNVFILAVALITIAEGQSRRRTPTARLVARRALSSLVLLVSEDSTEKRRFGSGFFVADDLVVTNYHVVRGNFTTEIHVKLVGQTAVHDLLDTISSIVAFNEKADLCILRVKAERGRRLDLAPNSQVAIGDEVYVAGNPEGLEGTLSQGIVSSIRQFNGIRYVQITAPVSAGSSGGPVLNKYGQVIAVATATLDVGQNLNFAIPVSYLSPLWQRACAHQRIAPSPA